MGASGKRYSNQGSQPQKTNDKRRIIRLPSYKMPRTGRTIEAESRLVFTSGSREREWEVTV